MVNFKLKAEEEKKMKKLKAKSKIWKKVKSITTKS